MATIRINFELPDTGTMTKESFVQKIRDFADRLIQSQSREAENSASITDRLCGSMRVPDDFDYKKELSER